MKLTNVTPVGCKFS